MHEGCTSKGGRRGEPQYVAKLPMWLSLLVVATPSCYNCMPRKRVYLKMSCAHILSAQYNDI